MVALLILAAGESSRIRFPKALLKIGEETFAEAIIRKAKACGIETIHVVTGPDHDAIIKKLPPQIRCIRNENFMQGQISSLQKGLQELESAVDGAMVWPVDQPLVQSETVRKIVDAYGQYRRALTIPVYKQRRGHPVIYNKKAMQAAIALKPHQTGKDLQSLFGDEITSVNVEDEGVVLDIDTQEDYERNIKA